MVTEYEQLLTKMLEEERAKLEMLRSKGARKEAREQEAAIAFVEVELDRYRKGMALFRTKKLPKVGRWGVPETEPRASPAS